MKDSGQMSAADEAFFRANDEKLRAEQIQRLTARIEALEAALRGLIEAVRIDSDEGGKGISGNTGARLYDARAALAPEQDK